MRFDQVVNREYLGRMVGAAIDMMVKKMCRYHPSQWNASYSIEIYAYKLHGAATSFEKIHSLRLHMYRGTERTYTVIVNSGGVTLHLTPFNAVNLDLSSVIESTEICHIEVGSNYHPLTEEQYFQIQTLHDIHDFTYEEIRDLIRLSAMIPNKGTV
ncbi:hypothetical protein VWH97_05615 [Escherichia coli O157]|nr:hypothetical protein [Escherichia coli O157]